MKNKLVLLLIIMIAFIGLSASYAVGQSEMSNNTTSLSIEYKQPMNPAEMVNAIQTQPFYKNYNHTTLEWIKGFSSDYVFLSNDNRVIIMNSTDAAKLAGKGDTGVSYTNNVTCKVLENRSLGNNLGYILHIEDVKVISKDSHNMNFGN